MADLRLHGRLDPEFVTIYFLQGRRLDQPLAVRRIWLILGLILFVFAAVGLRVWLEMQIVKVGYEITQLQAERDRLLDQQRLWLSQRNALASLERVEAIARQELGMQSPDRRQVFFLAEPVVRRGGWTEFWSGRGAPARWLKAWRRSWTLRRDSETKEAGLGGQDH